MIWRLTPLVLALAGCAASVPAQPAASERLPEQYRIGEGGPDDELDSTAAKLAIVLQDDDSPREVRQEILRKVAQEDPRLWRALRRRLPPKLRRKMNREVREAGLTDDEVDAAAEEESARAAVPIQAAAREPAPAPAPRPAPGPAPQVNVLVPTAELASRPLRKLAVPSAGGTGVDIQALAVLSDVALSEASASGLSVVGASDIEAMLGFEKQKDLLGCADDVSCVAQIGGALGVDALMILKVGKLGATYVLTATVIDIGRARAVVRGTIRLQATEEQLIEVVAAVVRGVLAPLAAAAG